MDYAPHTERPVLPYAVAPCDLTATEASIPGLQVGDLATRAGAGIVGGFVSGAWRAPTVAALGFRLESWNRERRYVRHRDMTRRRIRAGAAVLACLTIAATGCTAGISLHPAPKASPHGK